MKRDIGARTASAGPASAVGASQWLTLPGCKQVLVVVHTEVYGQRLRDVLPLLESDLRIQVDFTIAPHAFNAGAARSPPSAHAGLLPWAEALTHRYDLGRPPRRRAWRGSRPAARTAARRRAHEAVTARRRP